MTTVTSDSHPGANRFRPAIGRAVPAFVLRLVIAAIMVSLCVVIIGWQMLLAVALLLAFVALVFPRAPAAWALAAVLAIVALGGFGAAPGWKFYVVLAGAHALHVFGVTLTWLPGSGRVQLRVLGVMLRRFLVIQVPVQLLSLLVLTLLSGRSVVATFTSPVFGVVAGAGFLLLVVFVVVPALIRQPGREAE